MSKKKRQIWPTTVDNPFDPFTEWERWLEFDRSQGYFTCDKLATLAHTSNELTPAEDSDMYIHAVDSLIKLYWPEEVYVLAVEGKTRRFGKPKS